MSTDFTIDSFTDAAATLLENHTGETGATWAQTTKSLAVGPISFSDSNTIFGGIGSAYIASGTPESPDFDVSITASVKTLRSGDAIAALGRFTLANNGYLAAYSHGTGFLLQRCNGAGANTNLMTAVAGTIVDGDVLMLRMRGTTISVLLNGAVLGSATDATWSSAGVAGVLVSRGAVVASNTVGLHITSLLATSYPLAVAVTGGSPAGGRWIIPMYPQPWMMP